MIQRICHDPQVYTRICMYMYTQIASDFAEKEVRGHVTFLSLSRQKGKKEEEDMHRKSNLSKRKHCMCECVCVSKR